ncbi:MAG: translation initiation factor IF-2 [Spirochaetaceae bacterium]|jgi:translation initiation factor IF-2|nr:translation initiation factor IF-2 [Spirochaetaceae bacterium]
MAENDNIQKPKAELIKKRKGSDEAESAEIKTVHKVIKLKSTANKDVGVDGPVTDDIKIPDSPQPVSGPEISGELHREVESRESAPKKKVVVVKKKIRISGDGEKIHETGHIATEIGNAANPEILGENRIPAEKKAEGGETGIAPDLKVKSTEPGIPAPIIATPPVKRTTFSLPVVQRPAAKVGRVGGKFIGERPPRTEDNRRGGDGRPNDPARPPARVFNSGAPRQGSFGTGAAPGTRGGFTGQGTRFGSPRPGQQGGFGQRPPFGQGGGGGRFNQGAKPGVPGRGPVGSAPPAPQLEGKSQTKRSYKAKKSLYHREKEREGKLLQIKKRIAQPVNPVPKSIDIIEVVTVSELARKMNLKASDLIQKLMSMGMMVTINQQIDSETATILAAEYGAEVNIVNLYDETLIENEVDNEESMSPRPPVVTVMGHVDHGKTKLLDAIRNADVASGEFGGITQHIGAYMVKTPKGNITFLDTPGHEAFTRMRSRGAQVTDIVILVVAADDGVMPQTIEAINHAKEAAVPIIVAVNKVDKPEANPDRVKSQLSELGLQPEDWGGQTMFVEISALKRIGIEALVEAVLLQAEILDLKANYNRRAEGKILESRIDQGRGIVASLLIEKGTLQVGDSFVAGIWPGKVRALFNDKGEKVERAMPAMPVEVLGFEGIPNAGDPLQVVEDEKIARGFSTKRQELKRFEDAKHIKKITLDNLYDTLSDGAVAELKVIIKGDVQGSVEALKSSLEKLSTKEVRLNVIQALPGAIHEGDVDLAIASNAILIGFNVRPTPKAKALADQEKVDIRKYNIIYRVVEEMRQAMEGMLKPDTKEEVIGGAEVRNVFKMSKVGAIAGCYITSGLVKRTANINILRDHIVIHSGKIASLRRFKDDAKEVSAGFECGISIENFNDIREGDQLEIFEVVEVARKLS